MSFQKKHSNIFILTLVLMLIDYAAVVCAEYMALLSRQLPLFHAKHFALSDGIFWVGIPLLYIIVFQLEGLYKRKIQFWQMIAPLLTGCCYAVLSGIVLLYLEHVSETSSRLFVGFLWLWSMGLVVLFRYVGGKILGKVHVLQLPVIVIGGGVKAAMLVRAITNDAGLGYNILGVVNDVVPEDAVLQQYPYLGSTDKLEVILKKSPVMVMMATEGMELTMFKDLVFRVQALTKRMAIVPDCAGIPMGDLQVESFYMEKLMLLKTYNNLSSPVNRAVKVVFDYVATLLGVICISPILLLIAAKIYIDDPGPILFKHWRVGKDGKLFPCYKFRSMIVNSQQVLEDLLATDPAAKAEWEANYKLKNDPRITKLGAFLRRTSLDELPQLFNVLRGEMSLVGPRPIVQEELEKYYKGYEGDYLSVKPGVTGMWQVSGRSDLDYDERVELDRWYVRNWSFWVDIMLLWRTVKIVVKGKGAY